MTNPPKSGLLAMQLTRLFAFTGAVQGLVLWWLWHADKFHHWPASDPVAFAGLLYAAIAMPLALYWTEDIEGFSTRVRRVTVAGYLVVYALLGAYSAWVADAPPFEFGIRGADVLAAIVLGFVSLSLLCGFDFSARRWRYTRLFHYTWRNGILTATAAAMAGAVWTVLYAGAALMGLIKVNWISELIEEPVFAFPVNGLVVGVAFALGLARAAMTEAIRRFWLSISSWLLLLILFFGVMWVAWVPFAGLDALFRTKSAALIMLWFTALAVQFSNCAYQDGQIAWPYPRWLSIATQAAWLSLLPVVAIAWWALGLRVGQHGWSEDRLWAALVATVASIHVAGYALSWRRRERWMAAMARTNIVAALVLCGGLAAFLSPLANIQWLAVSAHMGRVAAAGGGVEPDWTYLRWDSGRFGHQALRALASGTGVPAGKPWAQRASEALAMTERRGDVPQEVSAALVAEKFTVYPAGKTLAPAFVAYLQSKDRDHSVRNCLRAAEGCLLWLGDLNGDGRDEVVLFERAEARSRQAGVLFSWGEKEQAWGRSGMVYPVGRAEGFEPELLQGAQAAAAQWRDLVIGGKRFRTTVHND